MTDANPSTRTYGPVFRVASRSFGLVASPADVPTMSRVQRMDRAG